MWKGLNPKLYNLKFQHDILEAIQSIPYPRSGSNFLGGLELLLTEVFRPGSGDRSSASNVAVVVKASLLDRRQDELDSKIHDVKQAGIHMLFVGITQELDETDAAGAIAAATTTGIPTFHVDRFVDLWPMVDDVAAEACATQGLCFRHNQTLTNSFRAFL